MNIEYMREFVEFARRLNFTSAARSLHMTQPALSNHIKSLEQEMGVELVERRPAGGARLTPAGQYFQEQACRILDIYDAMSPRIQDLKYGTRGKIIVRAPRNETSYPLLDYIQEFRDLHSWVDVDLRPWNEADSFADVAERNVDCVYAGYVDRAFYESSDLPRVGLVPFSKSEFVLWVDSAHPLAQVEKLELSCLDGHSFLIPANKRHGSWLASSGSVIASNGLNCTVKERYCDSLEDFMLSKVTSEDLMIFGVEMTISPTLRLRSDRVIRHFSPPYVLPVYLAYYEGEDIAANDRAALTSFVEFLEAKGESAS